MRTDGSTLEVDIIFFFLIIQSFNFDFIINFLFLTDIAEYHLDDGTFSIVDRMKNIVKLSQGEYIALEKVEGAPNTKYIAPKGLCVYADSLYPFLVGIVQVNLNELKKYARENEMHFETEKQLLEDPAIRKMVLNEINKSSKKNGLAKMEMVKDIRLVSEEWTPDNLLTAAMKFKRKELYQHYDALIKDMLEKNK